MEIVNVFDNEVTDESISVGVNDKILKLKNKIEKSGKVCKTDILFLEASQEGIVTNDLPLGNFTTVESNINVDKLLYKLNTLLT